MRNIQTLTIDINKKTLQPITANTGEVGSRFIKINIIYNGLAIDLTGIKVYLYAKKNDGNKVFNDVTIVNAKNGVVLAELTSQILALEGIVKLTLLLVEGNKKLATKVFVLKVDASIVDDEALESSNEFGALTGALGKVDEWNGYFEETSSQIEEKYTKRLNELDSQLDHIENDTSVKTDAKMKKCIVSFTDDDCRKEVYTILKPIADEKNVKFTLAMPTGKINTTNYLSDEQVKILHSEGWEFMWHTHTESNLDTMTLEQMENEYSESEKVWKRLSIPKNTIVSYPQGRDTHLARVFSSGKFKAGVDTFRKNNNVVPYSQYALSRYEIGTTHNEAHKIKLGSPYNTNTLEHYKWLVDRAESENAWLIFYTHAWYTSFDATQQQYLKDIIDYIRSKNIDIVTLEEGLKKTGNTISIGDDNGENYDKNEDGYYLSVGCDGSIRSSSLDEITPQYEYSGGEDYNTKPIVDFNIGITITAISSSDAANMPEGKAGTLTTIKPNQYSGYVHQEYVIYQGSIKYIRSCNTDGVWGNWSSITNIIYEAINDMSATSVADFSIGTTVNNIPTQYAANMPEGKAGTLITVKPNQYSGYTSQTYIIYATGDRYTRSCNNSNQWLEWRSDKIFVGDAKTEPINKPITNYKVGMTINYVGNNIANLMPGNKAGTLVTIRPTDLSTGYAYQEYTTHNEGLRYFRYCNTSGNWQAWKQYSFI